MDLGHHKTDYPELCDPSQALSDCAERLQNALTLSQVTEGDAKTGIFKTTFRGEDPEIVQSFLEKLGDVYRKEKKDGTGDVMIARRAWRDSDGDKHTEELGFLRIENPKEVENMIQQLAKQAAPANPSLQDDQV